MHPKITFSLPSARRVRQRLMVRLAFRSLLALGLPPLMFPLYQATAYAAPELEYQIKASLLYNFLQFVEWPPDSPSEDGPSEDSPSEDSPSDGSLSERSYSGNNQSERRHEFRICILGLDPFGSAITALEKELVKGSRIAIERIPDPSAANVDNCSVAFIGRSLENELPALLNSMKDKTVLTIGESPRFLEAGGIINFIIQDNKVRFEINRDAALQARLGVSSKLLRLAQRVI